MFHMLKNLFKTVIKYEMFEFKNLMQMWVQ